MVFISFEDTMKNPVFFNTYTLALQLLLRSSEILNSHSVDPKATDLILKGVRIMVKQMNQYSNQKTVENTLKDLNIKLDDGNEASQ